MAGSSAAQAQTGYTLVPTGTLTQTPIKFSGAVIASNATFWEIPYTVGAGAIASDPHLVMSSVSIPYDFATASPFTSPNYFVLGYSNITMPTQTQGKKFRGYLYGTRYAALARQGFIFNTALQAVSFAVFYSQVPLINTSNVPSVVDQAGSTLSANVTKLLVSYAGIDYEMYQTGNIKDIPINVSDPLWVFQNPTPFNLFPFIGGALWIKVAGQWAYEGAIVAPGGDILTATFTFLTGTGVQLMNPSTLAIIANATTIVGGGGNRSGPPRPVVNATYIYASVIKGKNLLGTQHVQVNNGGTGLLQFTIGGSAPWLKPSPTSGASRTAPVAIALNYKSASLAVGTYNTVLNVSNTNGIKVVNVQLQVLPVPVPIPSPVTASRNRSDGVLVSWRAVPVAVKYDVYRNVATQASGSAKIGTTATTSFLDTTAAPLQTYHYFVKAIDGSGMASGFSSQAAGVKQP